MPETARILVVDDDPSVTASLSLLLKQHGYLPLTAASPQEAAARVQGERVDLVLQDMNFSRSTTGEEGMELLRTLRGMKPELPVVLITAWGSIPLAVQGVKAGAADFVAKPWVNAQILQTVETALGLAAARAKAPEPPADRRDLDARYAFDALVGADPRFLRVLELAGRVAPTDASVLITGESGTGKELVAEAIHRNSRRRSGPFVKVNLGGISSTLFESEMFGHVRGAYTDARQDRRGRFEIAHGGTIFLDEIGELDPSSQVKLLRVLQDRTYEVLGSSDTRTVDVRILSATNRDLPAQVSAGQFREDLLYRLNLIVLRMPSLRERPTDVPILAAHFLEKSARAHARPPLTLTPAAVHWLRAQPWPGNVRQLRQTLERAVLVLEGDTLDASHLRALAELGAAGERAPSLPTPGAMTLDEIERAMIERALQQFGGNLTKAAEALGVSRTALYRRLQKHGIEAR
ncbi:MAG TPA: sigma-54 dependent transcriptional regulator [Candidatus Polarisedimenticolaceae bacterium]|nr:sigma-54 dependent transcriptional regulator [Candidatus Polarisedimenticolaceae bacterium]